MVNMRHSAVVVGLVIVLLQAALPQPGTTAEKFTSNGYQIHPRLEEIPGLKSGPFVRLADGAILTVEKNSSCISRDGGKTWVEHPIFADPDRFEIRPERALLRTGSGAIILAFCNGKEASKWKWNGGLLDPGTKLPTYAVRSLDEGKTWRDLQKLHDEWTGAIRDIIETKDGNVVFTSQMMLHSPLHHASVTYTSKTNGLNWIRSNVIDLGGVGHHAGVIEPTIEQLKDGRLWMLMRTNWGVFWEAYSDDEGLAWEHFKPTAIPASTAPGILERLQSGRLVLVWNRPFPEGKSDYPPVGGDGTYSEVKCSNHREELSMMLSDDDGKTWTTPVVIARVNEKSPTRTLAYPRIFEASPGEIWITTTYADFGGYLSVRLFEKDFVPQ
jgi:sialidase-1